jgi:hypothetical protein
MPDATICRRSAPGAASTGCGHGIEQERAPEVSAALINFLRHV